MPCTRQGGAAASFVRDQLPMQPFSHEVPPVNFMSFAIRAHNDTHELASGGCAHIVRPGQEVRVLVHAQDGGPQMQLRVV